ncbi:unnamed protein product [Psylliodes chrysocephalus]|uniref:DUF7869 domain-containing protein n=1 Tax=Psylliodes chrysocephalus TaxID=3402493 RepID=A0A9P0GM12_9CUCU|nr:unnamed protein product [Psylliodes chrysocephala]
MFRRSKKLVELALQDARENVNYDNSHLNYVDLEPMPVRLDQEVLQNLDLDILDEHGMVLLTVPNTDFSENDNATPLNEIFSNVISTNDHKSDHNIPGPSRILTEHASFGTNTDDSDMDFECKETSASLESENNSKISDVNEGKENNEGTQFGLKKQKKINKRQERKIKRNRGEKDCTYKGTERKERALKPHTCIMGKCPNKCRNFDEKTRNNVFKSFWSLSYQVQRDFIASNISIQEVKRRRTLNPESRKDLTRSYHLPLLNAKVKVCRKFFMNTLDVTDKLLRYTEIHRNDVLMAKGDQRGRHPPKNKTSDNLRTNVIQIHKIFTSGPHTEIQTEDFTEHIKEKEEVLKKFQEDQSISKLNKNKTICTSFDLQKVLGTPHGHNFLPGFSSKYAIYNLTFYESGTRNVECFLWEEADEKKGANEICTIVVRYLESVDERSEVKNILLYCVNCAGQNKNHQMICAVNWFLKKSKNIQKVVPNFLLPGHSYMPVDSVHATIENCIKNKTIWASSEWPTIIRNARVKYSPYNVYTLTFKDFLDWKTLQSKTCLTNLKTEDGSIIRLRDPRQIIFLKTEPDVINVSNNFANNNELLRTVIRKTGRNPVQNNYSLDRAYKTRLPISTEKHQSLRNLCTKEVIPITYHVEYLTLPSKPNIPNCLMETDEEDELQDED